MKILFTLLIAFLIFSSETKGSVLPQFRHVTIDNKVKIGYGVAIADMNADKKKDIILCDAKNIAWYENPSWEKHIICLLYTSPSPRDGLLSRMPSSA